MDKPDEFSSMKDLIIKEEESATFIYQQRNIPFTIMGIIKGEIQKRKKYKFFTWLRRPVPIAGIALLLIIFTFGLLYLPHQSYQNKVEHILTNIPALQEKIPTTNQTTTKPYNYQIQQLEKSWEVKKKDPTIREKKYTSQYLEETFINILAKKNTVDNRSLK
jgi:hypothetical protein